MAQEEEPLTGGQRPASPRQTHGHHPRLLQSYWGGGELAWTRAGGPLEAEPLFQIEQGEELGGKLSLGPSLCVDVLGV